jgi:hypothetical protein
LEPVKEKTPGVHCEFRIVEVVDTVRVVVVVATTVWVRGGLVMVMIFVIASGVTATVAMMADGV